MQSQAEVPIISVQCQSVTMLLLCGLLQAVTYDNPLCNTKYCVQQLMHDNLDSESGRKLLSSTSVRDIW